jgi:hypothetical protein
MTRHARRRNLEVPFSGRVTWKTFRKDKERDRNKSQSDMAVCGAEQETHSETIESASAPCWGPSGEIDQDERFRLELQNSVQ